MVDGSNSVGYTSFDKMKAWIGDFVKNFDLSESTTRVGLVQYSDRISTRNGSIDFLTNKVGCVFPMAISYGPNTAWPNSTWGSIETSSRKRS